MGDEGSPAGRIVTFYSYKGGTGRSMAMANVAWVLALSGFSVLVVDWDLEAPGLHRYFRPFLDDPELEYTDGLIDFAIHFAEAASEQIEEPATADWYKPYSNLLPYAKPLKYSFPNGGALDFIPAGRQDSEYAGRVNSFNWKHFYLNLNGGKVLEEARRILKEEYQYILVDSRTGVSDTAGICTMQMPDDLVVGFTLNLQSVIGASGAAASVVEKWTRENPIRVFPVPMRVEFNEKIKTTIMKAFAKPKFTALLPNEMTEEQKDRYWATSDVPYIPFYAFEENLAYFRDEPNDPNSVLAAMIRIANRLTPSAIGELPRPDAEVLASAVAAYDAFSGATAVKVESPKLKPAVYVSADSDSSAAGLQVELERSGYEILTRERYEKARVAIFLTAIGSAGLTPSQSADLALAERTRNGSIYTVLLPRAEPETLPRLLLPYGVIDLRSGGAFALPDPTNSARLKHLPVTPYPGLNPFTASDGPVFFARGPLIARLVEAVTRSNFVALIGPPSSGRTSLVQAGLIPRLKALQPPNSAWEVASGWPVTARDSTRTLLVMNAKALAAVARPGAVPETVCVLAIAETVEQAMSCELGLRMSAEKFEVPPLSAAELAAAIVEPAARAGLPIEPGLASRIVNDLKSEQGQLPLLQFVMSELYAEEPRGVLSLEKYQRMGGIGMVEQRCERVYRGSGLSSLSRLVSVAEDGTLTPQKAPESMLANREVLDAFVSAGILVRDASLRTDGRVCENSSRETVNFFSGASGLTRFSRSGKRIGAPSTSSPAKRSPKPKVGPKIDAKI
jgi:cellulose biosynthesis protein BcsQ